MTTQLQFIIIRRPAWRGRGFRVSYLRIALLSVICWCALYLRSSLHVFLTTTVALHSKHIHTYRCSFFFNTSVKMAVRGRNMLEVYHRFVSYYNPEFWCVCVCVCVWWLQCALIYGDTVNHRKHRDSPENGDDFLHQTSVCTPITIVTVNALYHAFCSFLMFLIFVS